MCNCCELPANFLETVMAGAQGPPGEDGSFAPIGQWYTADDDNEALMQGGALAAWKPLMYRVVSQYNRPGDNALCQLVQLNGAFAVPASGTPGNYFNGLTLYHLFTLPADIKPAWSKFFSGPLDGASDSSFPVTCRIVSTTGKVYLEPNGGVPTSLVTISGIDYVVFSFDNLPMYEVLA